ncbi:ABC-type multidrug transport system, ATPase component [gut metagenome]|uniref:ABC-type multidrug transport system, ATPase component n=1 Tax=gut metagenome TaxID=749906 RepID=J9FS58_9ZZZZ
MQVKYLHQSFPMLQLYFFTLNSNMEFPIVKLEHLSHRYSIQWAIKDIDFEITKPGIYGLLGSNGAGKSTTMNIMCGVLKQTEGDVYIQGYSMSKDPVEAKRRIGFLPQTPPLHPDLTVTEYLTYCAGLRYVPKDKVAKAVDEVLERCHLEHFRHRLIHNLSGGYQQRVGIAQAIIHHPDLVVFDEPTNGLDPNQILDVRHLIKEIAEERTVILSTHILSEVQAICDYIHMIEQGRLVFAGTVEEFDNYIVPDSLFVSLMAMPSVEDLRRVPGVLEVEELGGPNYRIKFSDYQEVTNRLVEVSVARNWYLTEMYLEKSSMNAVFAELSKKK